MDQAVVLTSDGCVDGRPAALIRRTHCAQLWFVEDRVYKCKRPVDLGFLDFTTLAARRAACERELTLNRRLAPDVYLGVVDVHDVHGTVIDAAVVMRRLPDARRLATLVSSDADVTACVQRIARRIAALHAAQPASGLAHAVAGRDALLDNWRDNLEVLRAHGELVERAKVDEIAADVERYLAGRGPLIAARIADGLVRDGHGDLQAGDIFCLDDGPRILDCLEFDDRYRVGDVLLDVAFLAMDLKRLGRADLAGAFVDAYREFTNAHHPQSLVDHFVAYRAGVRAKVACLSAAADATGEHARTLADIACTHLRRARVRLVLVGGLPGTGKSTLADALSGQRGWALLRTDEVRKDLVGVGHRQQAGPDAYRSSTTAATYAEVLRRAERLLGRGESVIVDASWADAAHREAAAMVAARTASDLTALQCVVAPDVARDRLMGRRDDPSDATQDVYDAMRARFAAWPDALIIDSSGAVDEVTAAATAAIIRRGPG